eukprot:226926_1
MNHVVLRLIMCAGRELTKNELLSANAPPHIIELVEETAHVHGCMPLQLAEQNPFYESPLAGLNRDFALVALLSVYPFMLSRTQICEVKRCAEMQYHKSKKSFSRGEESIKQLKVEFSRKASSSGHGIVEELCWVGDKKGGSQVFQLSDQTARDLMDRKVYKGAITALKKAFRPLQDSHLTVIHRYNCQHIKQQTPVQELFCTKKQFSIMSSQILTFDFISQFQSESFEFKAVTSTHAGGVIESIFTIESSGLFEFKAV